MFGILQSCYVCLCPCLCLHLCHILRLLVVPSFGESEHLVRTPLPLATMIASLLKRNNQLSQGIGLDPPPSLPPKLCYSCASSSSFQFQPRSFFRSEEI